MNLSDILDVLSDDVMIKVSAAKPFLGLDSIIVISGFFLYYRIVNQSDEEFERGMRYYFDRLHSRRMKRQRRKAYWRLLKYKISKRRANRKSPAFQKGDYFYDYLHKD